MRDEDKADDALANTAMAPSSGPQPISGVEPTVSPLASQIDPLEATIAPSDSKPPTEPPVVRAGSRPPKRTKPPSTPPPVDHAGLREVDPGDYALGAELARGGMGRIRHARDLRLGRPVAVKELLAKDPALAERFEREIRLTARLQHPSIVSIYEAGRWPSGEPFYAMRVVPGKALDAVVAPLKKLAERLALVPNVIAIVEALAYAHDQKIIHRDLKPGNVLIGPFGETVVIDWGLAKDLAAADTDEPKHPSAPPKPPSKPPSGANLTMAGSVMGTLAYMPPEQAAGETVDERADVYSLGALLYHVLAGRPPFVDRRSDELLVKVLSRRPPALAELVDDIPQDLIAIVEKAMARKPEERYASARELAGDLKRFQTGQLVGAQQYSWWALLRRWVSKHRTVVSVAALAVVALAVTATLLVIRIVKERDRAEQANVKAETERRAALDARDEVVIASARLHFDQGRQELLDGNPLKASVLLRAALAAEDTPATRLLTGLALQSLKPLVRRFEGLAEPIIAAGFISDGSHLFAATWLGKVRFWDSRTGATTMSFDRAAKLTDAGISPDGSLLLAFTEDSEVELWETKTNKKRGTIAVPGGTASRAEFGPDGGVLAVIGESLTIWDIATLQMVATGPSLDGDLLATMLWVPEGKRMILGGGSAGTIAIVDTTTWKTVRTLKARGSDVRDFAISPDSRRFAYVTPEGGEVLELATGKLIATLEGADQQRTNHYRGIEWGTDDATLVVSTFGANAKIMDATTGRTRVLLDRYSSIVFDRSGKRLLAYPQATGTLALLDAVTGKQTNELAGHAHAIASAMFSPDGSFVLTASDDGTLALWDTTRDDSVTRAPLRQRARAARFSADGDHLATGSDDGTVDVYDARSGERLRTLGAPSEVPADPIIELVPDGRMLTVLGSGKIVELWNLASGARLTGFDAAAPIRRAGLTTDGTRVWAATHTGLHIWDVRSGGSIAAFPHVEPDEDPPSLVGHHSAAALTGDGRHALIPVDVGVAIIDVASKQQISVLPEKSDVWSVIASPASDRALVIATSGTTLFDLTTHKPIGSLVAQGEIVLDAVFAPDGANIYTRGSDAAVRRWDARSGALAVTFEDEQGMGLQLYALQPGGAMLATFGNNLAHLWDTRTGKLLAERDTGLDDKSGIGTLLTFSPDGKLVASGHGGIVWTWLLPTWRASLDDLDRVLACQVPWKLVDGTVMPRALDPSCK